MICNNDSLRYVKNVKVHDINIWSDHCAISCVLNCNIDYVRPITKIKENTINYKWNPEKKEKYIENIESEDGFFFTNYRI